MLDETTRGLENFRRQVVRGSKRNLKDSSASGKLSKSITSKLKKEKDEYVVSFYMEEHGEYLDKGVSGVKRRYNTPYSYKSKGGKRGLKGMPPPSKFDKWGVRRGVAPRDEKGRFLDRKQVNFLIAKSVFEKGIRPRKFFTKAFDKHYDLFLKQIEKDFSKDVELIFKKSINSK